MSFRIRMGVPEMAAYGTDFSARKRPGRRHNDEEKFFKKLVKAPGFLVQNPRHPGLASHEIDDLTRPQGIKVFQSYPEDNSPAVVDVAFCQLVPWPFDPNRQSTLKRTFRRVSFAGARLLANQWVRGSPPILPRFHAPAVAADSERRWRTGLYLDQPEEWDDPSRFFRG